MTFPTVVFGTGTVTSPGNLNFIDRNNIPTGGFRLFIVPTNNIGLNGIDIGFTYINQFGVLKTTSVTTAVAPSTTAGTHIQAVLEAGDTGIRDIIAISVFIGGTSGDRLSFESWNEGIGRAPIDISYTAPFDRTVPGAYLPEPYIGLWKGIYFNLSNFSPTFPYEIPSIRLIDIPKSLITEFFPEVIIDRGFLTRVYLFDKGEIIEFIPELELRNFVGKPFFVFKTWLESVVGQVLSGYVQNVSGETIKNAFSMILMSPPTDVNPSGTTSTADVNPDTGLYQAFLKKVVYDRRFIIVKVGIRNIALEGAGIPTVVDGNQQLPIPYNLQFACPVKNCDFTIARKIV